MYFFEFNFNFSDVNHGDGLTDTACPLSDNDNHYNPNLCTI